MGLAEALLAEGAVATGEEAEIGQVAFLGVGEAELNRKFKYLRFSPAALR